MHESSEKLKLHVSVPHVDGDLHLKVMTELYEKYNYEEEYWRAIAPPNKFVFIFNDLNDDDVEIIKNKMREIYSDVPEWARGFCNFKVNRMENNV